MTHTDHPQPWSHQQASVNGLRLHYVEMGSGPLVVLLHGFPEFWYSWRHQLPALAAAGFRAVSVDLRGYNESDKPTGIRNYRLSVLVQDVLGLLDHFAAQRAIIVGHDWGGVIAWQLAMSHPERVERLAVLNAPHPAILRREMRNPMQWLRSWYVFFFQLPWLPEWLLRRADHALLERMLRRQPRRPGAFTDEDIAHYKRALGQPGAATATLNYYRAAMRSSREVGRALRPVAMPVLLIWGEHDPYLGIRMTNGLERWVADLRIERLPDASHWVQNDQPEQVNRLLCAFLLA
jgi:pimeloyl-ACP methyl ester carboxylesterase